MDSTWGSFYIKSLSSLQRINYILWYLPLEMRWVAWLLLFIHSCVGDNKLSHFSYAKKKKREKKTWKNNVDYIFKHHRKSFGKCSPGMKEVQIWWKIGCKHEYELVTTNVQAIIKMQKKKVGRSFSHWPYC